MVALPLQQINKLLGGGIFPRSAPGGAPKKGYLRRKERAAILTKIETLIDTSPYGVPDKTKFVL